jgi:predicted RNA-binding Zn-ribbon protein involved in translation (DUF1610 family)
MGCRAASLFWNYDLAPAEIFDVDWTFGALEIGVLGSPVSDAHLIKFQCPGCGHELQQSIVSLKQSTHMRWTGCDVGINIDTNRLANAAEEIRRALEKVPPEITIKFFDLA